MQKQMQSQIFLNLFIITYFGRRLSLTIFNFAAFAKLMSLIKVLQLLIMQECNYKNNTLKRNSSIPQSENENSASPNRLFQQMMSSKLKGDPNQTFVFSLSGFQKQSTQWKTSNETAENEPKPIGDQNSFIRQSGDSEKQSKRCLIYGNQSQLEKEQEEQILKTTAQSNNDLFSMIFLNKAAQKLKNLEKAELLSTSPLKNESKIKSTEGQQKNKSDKKVSEGQNIAITDFQVGKKLGAGKFGQVYLARHKATGFFCALKKIQKAKIDSKLAIQLMREIKIQSFLNHPNIVKMYSFFADAQSIYLLMQLCYSGQLYGYLKKKRRLSEDMTRNIINQVCRALDYMHENQILHRDLKPQNIIYQSGLVKICDFGWSISSNTMRGTFCGTPLYVSPELLKRKNYNNKIDVWSVGIMTYELLFGKVPFEIENERDFIKIVQDQLKFSKVTKISEQAKDFIMNCLQKDPRERYTVPELLQHAFLLKTEAVSMSDMY